MYHYDAANTPELSNLVQVIDWLFCDIGLWLDQYSMQGWGADCHSNMLCMS